MLDISYYQKINNTYKSGSKQETELYLVNRNEDRFLYDNIDTKKVLKNGEPFELLVIKGTSDVYKKIKSKNSTPFNLGDYIEWDNRIYLVTYLDPDDKVHHSGTMTICMFKLSWQRKDGKLISRWGAISDASKYESGISSNGVLTVPMNTNGIVLPYDEETKFLKRDRRFIMDKLTGEDYEETGIVPDAYKLTNDKPILNDYTYFDRGATITLLLGASQFDAKKDKWIDGYGWICDYFDPQNPTPDPVFNYSALISGSSTIKSNKRTWKVSFKDENENNVEFHDFIWKVDCGEYDDFIEMLYDDDDCSIGLKCKDYNENLGNVFTLVVAKLDGTILTSIDIEVVGM